MARRMLLVDDSLGDIELTRRVLTMKRIVNELVVASDGKEALDYLFGTGEYAGRDTSDQPALILLDLRMPRVDGLTVLKEVKADERTRMIPIVIFTTATEEADLRSAYGLGANSFIRKPIDFTEFAEAVSQAAAYWLNLNQPAPAARQG